MSADKVRIVLAHPLTGPRAEYLGLGSDDLPVGSVLEVTPDMARTIDAGGYAQRGDDDKYITVDGNAARKAPARATSDLVKDETAST